MAFNEKQEILKEASKSVFNTGKLFFPHYFKKKPSPLHYHLSSYIKRCLFSDENLVVALPRGMAKTTYIWLFTPVYILFFTSLEYIVFISKTTIEAQTQLDSKLRQEIKKNERLKEFGVEIGKYDTKDRISLKVPGRKREIIFDAASQGINIRGKSIGNLRPQVIFGDDVERQQTESQSGVESPHYRERVWKWLFQQVIPAGEDSSLKIFISGTIMHEDQMLMRLIKSPPDFFKFNTIKHGYVGYDKETNKKISLWPDKYSIHTLQAMKEQYRKDGLLEEYYMEYESTLVSDEIKLINKQDFKYFDVLNDKKKVQLRDTNEIINLNYYPCFFTVDPALSQNKQSDDAVIEVFFLIEEDKRLIWDIEFSNEWDDKDVLNKIFFMEKMYNPKKVGIEEAGGQKYFISHIEDEQHYRRQFFKIKEIKGYNVSKLEKLKFGLKLLYKSGKCYHRAGAKYREKLEDQITSITKDKISSTHDDLADATAMQHKVVRTARSYISRDKNDKKYNEFLERRKANYGVF